MVENSDEPSLLDRTRSSPGPAYASAKSYRNGVDRSDFLNDVRQTANSSDRLDSVTTKSINGTTGHNVPDNVSEALPPPAPPPGESGQGEESSTLDSEKKGRLQIFKRFFFEFQRSFKVIVLSTWLNVLLVFVPVGIAVHLAHLDATIVFVMNAVAIVPLAGLLSYATENVASDLGDTIGSLMNVTFGNAVELIIFIIALAKDQIPIVQASLLGSMLANLLLILGMCFLFGGLLFREQIYNSTVTQMSACLLSLSVMSLLLPTAFHASFDSSEQANRATLDISRGTSVILLLVYVLYLLFQLKSHAYMYQSTPQHVIDEESHPGFLHDVFDTSSSSDSSSSSSTSDSDATSGSNTTAKRIKRVLKRGRRRRKSSGTSTDTPSARSVLGSPTMSTFTVPEVSDKKQHRQTAPSNSGYVSGEEADDETRRAAAHGPAAEPGINSRDFENEKASPSASTQSPEATRKKVKKSHRQKKKVKVDTHAIEMRIPEETVLAGDTLPQPLDEKARPMHSQEGEAAPEILPRRPFNLRGISMRDALPAIPAIPRLLPSTVFSTTANPAGPMAVTGVTPRALHRSRSLPSRLNSTARPANQKPATVPALQPQPYLAPVTTATTVGSDDSKAKDKQLSRVAAIILLLCSTALVAVCAEFLVDSINEFVGKTDVSTAFVGLIILPIVGNAAEHVCAVTVASKNKMDLAIGVAVGSSIQIALFVTPVIVLLGWMMGKDMSLYFSLFETISLFVSAFIVNFLVLDGRSNYLEGSLLVAAYVIIGLAAWFYPESGEASLISGVKPDVDHIPGNGTALNTTRLMF